MSRGEEGQVTAFVVGTVLALFLLGGLVIDGGYTLAARRRAFDEASAAARAGAQALDVQEFRSSGRHLLDPAAAERGARSFLAATGQRGSVEVTGDRVAVEVVVSQPMAMLRIVGLSQITVTGRGKARLAGACGAGAP